MSACTSARPLRYALFAVEPDEDEVEVDDDDVLDELPLDELFESDDDVDDESEPFEAVSFTFSLSFEPPFDPPERLSVL
jgi:hypothetical protein